MRLLSPLLAVSAALALLGCVPKPAAGDRPERTPPRVPDGLVRVLRAEDRRVVDADLERALRDRDAVVRAAAVRAYGRIAPPEAGTVLEGSLDDSDPRVRAAAAFGLGLLAKPEFAAALGRPAADEDPLVRALAAQSLGRLAEPLTAPLLLGALGDEAPEVREEAALAAWRYPDPASFVDRLIAGTADSEPKVRFASAYALARLGSAPFAARSAGPVPGRLAETDLVRVRSVLRSLAGAKEPELRMQAARGLARPRTPEEESTLGALAADLDPGVRVHAARSLAYEGAPVAPHLLKLVRDSDAAVTRAALEGLGAVRTSEAARVLLEGLERERRGFLLEAAIASLVDAYKTLAPPHLTSLALDPDPRVRARVAALLARYDDSEAEILARAFTRDRDSAVRAAAVPVAARFEPIDGPLWRSALEDEDPAVRGALAEAVGIRWKRPGEGVEAKTALWPVLTAAWERAAGDVLPDARTAVLETAVVAKEDPRARAFLESGLGSPDPVTRRRAGDLFLDAYGEDRRAAVGAVVDLPLEHYREIVEWASLPRAAVVTVQRPGFAPGRFVLRLLSEEAPLAARNFTRLAESGFFDGLAVHRLVPNFVVQTGDPRGDGLGGPGYAVRDEFGPRRFWAGTVGMATDGPDSAGSQWFVALSAQPHLDGRYTAFAWVTQNFEGVAARLLPGDRIVRVEVYEGDGSEPLPPGP
jgi:cyclophilin family peptidyl-prolyl cis-trans isomerase/HEAT repeat protein